MRTVQNKKLKAMSEAVKVEKLYSHLIIAAMNEPVAGQGGAPSGFSPEEMRERINIIDKIENAKLDDEVDFEDAEFIKLQACVARVKWLKVDKEILEFTDYIKDLGKKEEPKKETE